MTRKVKIVHPKNTHRDQNSSAVNRKKLRRNCFVLPLHSSRSHKQLSPKEFYTLHPALSMGGKGQKSNSKIRHFGLNPPNITYLTLTTVLKERKKTLILIGLSHETLVSKHFLRWFLPLCSKKNEFTK